MEKNILRVLAVLENKENWSHPYDVVDEHIGNLDESLVNAAVDAMANPDLHLLAVTSLGTYIPMTLMNRWAKRKDVKAKREIAKRMSVASPEMKDRMGKFLKSIPADKRPKSFHHLRHVFQEEMGTSRGKGVAPRNFGAMKNVDLIGMAKDALKKKYKTREAAIAALHTLPIANQNALDKNKYRPPLRIIGEKLTGSDSAATYIHDFVHSKNARFKNDSKKERIKRALAAYYHKEDVGIDEDLKNPKTKIGKKTKVVLKISKRLWDRTDG